MVADVLAVPTAQPPEPFVRRAPEIRWADLSKSLTAYAARSPEGAFPGSLHQFE
jgi:hypothetical protein